MVKNNFFSQFLLTVQQPEVSVSQQCPTAWPEDEAEMVAACQSVEGKLHNQFGMGKHTFKVLLMFTVFSLIILKT